MNTVLLTTKYNRNEMIEFAKQLATRQSAPNTGKLVVVAGSYLDDEALQLIGNTLKPCYEVVELSKVQLSADQTADSQNAVMIATWQMQRYTSAPGPWLVVDSPCEIIADNPLTLMERLHNASGADNSGRASTLGGGKVPQGPVIIGAEAKRIRTLRSVSGQDWRSRGRWVFNVCSWYQFQPEEYPFRLVAKIEEPASSAQESYQSVVVKKRATKTHEGVPTIPVSKSNNRSTPSAGAKFAGMQGVSMAAVAEADGEGTDEFVQRVAEATGRTPEEIYAASQELKSHDLPAPGHPSYQPPRRDLTDEELASLPVAPESGTGEIEKHEPTGLRPAKKPFIPVEPDSYSEVTDAVLRDQIFHRSGRKAHPATSREKLIKKLEALDAK